MLRVFAAVFLLAIASNGSAQPRRPVLLELFTSEGCSSCPPADALLEKLDKLQPVPGAQILVLSEHVDYWNHDDFRDPFSSASFTARQRNYADRFHLEDVYTPQLVVDGAAQVLGSDPSGAIHAVEQAGSAEKLDLKLTMLPNGRAQVVVPQLPASLKANGASVFLAIADNEDSTDVHGGENKGRRLHHVAVVRSLNSLGKINAQSGLTKEVSLGNHTEHSRVIAFVQESKQGRVIGSAQLALP